MSKQLNAEIVLDLKGNLASKAKSYSHQMSVLGSKSQRAMTMMDNSARAASRGIDTLGNRTVIGAGIMAVAFERTFVKTAAQFERYQIMLNQLQGSEAAGAEALAWIEDFTQNTPYAINQVTDSFVRLKAFGIDPMDGSMQAIVDQAAMMGGTAETVEGIARALGQAWTKGKLQAEEANQMLERGVPVWDYLTKISKELGHNNGFGHTAAEIQKMSEKGELGRESIRRLIEEMGKASDGAALNQMKTWNGMISNMGDHWTMFQKDVMQSGAFEKLKTELSEVLEKLDEMKMTGEYDNLVETVGENLVNAFETAGEAIKAAKDVGAALWPVLRTIGQGANAIADAVGGYGNLAKTLAAVYALNKAVRMGAPLIKGAMAMTTKHRNPVSEVLAGASKVAVQKVWVVNMPMDGFGGAGGKGGKKGKVPTKRIPGLDRARAKPSIPTRISKIPSSTAPMGKGYGLGLGLASLLLSAKEYNQAEPMFPTSMDTHKPEKAPLLTKDAQQRSNAAFQAAYGDRKPSAFSAMSQHPAMVPAELKGNIKIGIKVDQDGRVASATATSDLPGVAMED
ncbi:tape measure protein [Vibrio europaeus]|nr:tape measure protein [Vibrio europaeus]MDC5753863.1 tape measure protein [Vibrio europaeus]MDC5776775.1 tape measure protein [Vibrio europaeus]MDC5796791.1 tape measure protein [Vibrio europaeus]MDC5801788.1 tape measure protein [Vibrio europaeus]MDC5815761.1 tape measure protein [Vibrio europaeus]